VATASQHSHAARRTASAPEKLAASMLFRLFISARNTKCVIGKWPRHVSMCSPARSAFVIGRRSKRDQPVRRTNYRKIASVGNRVHPGVYWSTTRLTKACASILAPSSLTIKSARCFFNSRACLRNSRLSKLSIYLRLASELSFNCSAS
jgi:hypothetical protein